MKNIIIGGPGRCGKTTLAVALSYFFGLTHYKSDTIVRAAREQFYSGESMSWPEISEKVANMFKTIFHEKDTDSNPNIKNYVLDTCHPYPIDIYNSGFNNSDTIVIYLGFPSITKEEKLKIVRENDRQGSWTSNVSDEKLLSSLNEGIEFSKEAKKQCEECEFKFFDTGYDYYETLADAFQYILEEFGLSKELMSRNLIIKLLKGEKIRSLPLSPFEFYMDYLNRFDIVNLNLSNEIENKSNNSEIIRQRTI